MLTDFLPELLDGLTPEDAAIARRVLLNAAPEIDTVYQRARILREDIFPAIREAARTTNTAR